MLHFLCVWCKSALLVMYESRGVLHVWRVFGVSSRASLAEQRPQCNSKILILPYHQS